jgi:hypothetical protein
VGERPREYPPWSWEGLEFEGRKNESGVTFIPKTQRNSPKSRQNSLVLNWLKKTLAFLFWLNRMCLTKSDENTIFLNRSRQRLERQKPFRSSRSSV